MKVQNRLKELVAKKERLEGRKVAYTYAEIAEATGVDYRTVSSWMRNDAQNFTGRVIISFCEWLDCGVGELLLIESGKMRVDISGKVDISGQLLPNDSQSLKTQPALGATA